MTGSLRSQLQWIEPSQEAVARLTDPGVYQLHLRVPADVQLEIGKLGTVQFPAGTYFYTGSALGGLGARLARHLRSEKTRRWHIDYLLDHAQIVAIAILPTRERLECALHAETVERLDGRYVANGFGSSDCRCRAHLAYLGGRASDGQEALRTRSTNPPGRTGAPKSWPAIAAGRCHSIMS